MNKPKLIRGPEDAHLVCTVVDTKKGEVVLSHTQFVVVAFANEEVAAMAISAELSDLGEAIKVLSRDYKLAYEQATDTVKDAVEFKSLMKKLLEEDKPK